MFFKPKRDLPEPVEQWSVDPSMPKDPVYDSRTVNFWKYRAFDKRN